MEIRLLAIDGSAMGKGAIVDTPHPPAFIAVDIEEGETRPDDYYFGFVKFETHANPERRVAVYQQVMVTTLRAQDVQGWPMPETGGGDS